MSNKKQTAVEWFFDKIIEKNGLISSEDVKQAKEMEKENALRFGAKCCIMTTQKNDWTLENLYNETYETK
jgi:hypothetical protein